MKEIKKGIRILYVITGLGIGGTGYQLYYLVRELRKRGYEIKVCSLTPGGEMEKELINEGIEVVNIQIKSGLDILALVKIYSLIKSFQPHIVSTWLFNADVVGRIAAILARVKVIISMINSIESWKTKKHIYIDKFLSLFTDVIVTICERSRNFSSEQEHINIKKFFTIYNGLDWERFNQEVDRQQKLKGLSISENSFIVTVVSRLESHKGHRYLFMGIKDALPVIPDLLLLVIGDGPQRNDLIELAERIGISKAVKFLGKRYDIPDLLNISDLFILPSLREGLPNVILEAMASGLPVIATDVGGSSEIVEHGKTGILIKDKSPAEIKEAIIYLYYNKEIRDRLAKNSREKVEREFNLKRYVASYEELYKRLLKSKGVPLDK